MNTGIGDSVNLAWKLASVLRDRAALPLLDTYEPERIAFARRLVDTTDRAFTVVTSPGSIARIIRVAVVPRVLPLLFRSTTVRRFMFRTVSQIGIHYRDSRLSQGAAGRVRSGDRLPWVAFSCAPDAETDNFVPLNSLDWQAHVYGTCPPYVAELCERWGLAFHSFPWEPAVEGAGLQRGALYLVRPDGYVSLADADANAATLKQYVRARGIKFEDKGNR
jgi:hypothetical protein